MTSFNHTYSIGTKTFFVVYST